MRTKITTLCCIVLLLLATAISPKQLLAAPYYEGKTIKIIVGNEPGGGYDRAARLLAKHLSKHIPGKPAVIIENMAGASSIIAANHLYNIAKPDGLTIGTFNRELPFAQLLKAEGVRFDITKYSWIGSAGVEATVLCIHSDLPYKTFEDLIKSKTLVHLSSVGTATLGYQFPILLKEFLGLNVKVISYPSSAAGTLAIERKEVDGKAGSYNSLKPSVDRSMVRLLIRGRVSESGIENLPVDEDLAKDRIGKTVMAMRSAPDGIGRPYVAPPRTPPDVVNTLRDAFARVAKDPELREDSKKMMMSVQYVSAEETAKVLNYLLNQPEDMVKEFSKYIKF